MNFFQKHSVRIEGEDRRPVPGYFPMLKSSIGKVNPGIYNCNIHPVQILLLLLFFFLQSFSRLQSPAETDYAIHANIIYHFTKYVDWPANRKYGDFIIGVSGESPLYDELDKHISGKMAGKQKIVIKRLSSSVSPYNCHILFVGDDESSSLKKLAARTIGSPILIVTESEGLALKGSCINFVIISDHLKLEINKNNLEARHLSIASELLQLGKIVK